MSEQDRPYKPYDSAFKTLIAACPQLLIPVVNDMFGTRFTDADKVVLMDSKQMKPLAMGKILTREVDSLFAIGGDWRRAYHVELQSTPDGVMVARFWEYDSHTAMMTAEITPDGRMRVRFPHSAVLYLRHSASTPEELTIEVENDEGEVFVAHKIPVVKVQRYDLDELIRKDLLFLFPYYLFRYEDMIAEYDADDDRSAALREDLARMLKHLDDEREAGRIDRMTQRSIQGAMMSVLSGLARGHDNVMKGVGQMLEGQILDLDVFRIHDRAWDEGEAAGRAEGRAEGELKTYIGLVRDNIMEPSVAAARLRISESEFRAKCDAVPIS